MDPLEPEAFVDPMTLGLINRTTGHDQDADMRTVSTKDESIRAMLRSVRKAKDTAVKDEKFVQAKQLKGLMELLQKAAEEVAKLEIIKANAIHHEDYDLAENIKVRSLFSLGRKLLFCPLSARHWSHKNGIENTVFIHRVSGRRLWGDTRSVKR